MNFVFFVLLSCALVASTAAQQPARRSVVDEVAPARSTDPLKNADVLQMVHSGAAPDVVVDRIKHSATDFDISPAAVESLQEHEVPVKVLLAMSRTNDNVMRANLAVPDAAMLAAEAKQLRARCPNGKRLFYAFVNPNTGDVFDNWLSGDQLKALIKANARWSTANRPFCTTRYAEAADYIVLHSSASGFHVYLRTARGPETAATAVSRRHNQDSGEKSVNFRSGLGGWSVFLQSAHGEVEASDHSAYLVMIDPRSTALPYACGRHTFLVGIYGEPDKRCLTEALEHLRKTSRK